MLDGHSRTCVVEGIREGRDDRCSPSSASCTRWPEVARAATIRKKLRSEGKWQTTKMFTVTGMTCDNCVQHVTKAIKESRRHSREGRRSPRRRRRSRATSSRRSSPSSRRGYEAAVA